MPRLALLSCIFAWTLYATSYCQAQSHAALTGIWKSNQKQPFFFQVTPAKNGIYQIPYGYERCGIWGTITANRQGGQLSGRYKSSLDAGDIRIEFNPSQHQAMLHWKDDETQRTGSYRLSKISSSFEDGMLDSNPKEKAWRDKLIESHVQQAVQGQITQAEWSDRCNMIRREMEQARKWPKGWPLPSRIREIGWNDWEIGWIEIDFLGAVRACLTRDLEPPFSEIHHVRFHQSEKPRSGFDAQHETSYRKTNQVILDQFMDQTGGRTGAAGIRYTRAYYAMWDYLTANESHGVIARVIREGVDANFTPKLGLYNDSHQTLTGQCEAVIRDGERVIATKTGKVTISPYEEISVDIDPRVGYPFFAPHVTLTFIPEDHPQQSIPKDRLTPFHKTMQEYVAISNQEMPEKDFTHAMLWGRVEQAWDSNDLLEYRRAVRDAGSCLYRYRGQQPEVREYVRKYLGQLEDTRATLVSGTTSEKVKFNFKYDPVRGNLISYKQRELNRLNPEVFTGLDVEQEEFKGLRGRLAAKIKNQEQQDVTIYARIESGRLFLDTSGYEVLLTGTVTMYDGPVEMGKYSVIAYTDQDGVPFTNSCRMTTFYQESSTFKLELELHYYHKRSFTYSKPAFNLLLQLQKAGAFVQPIYKD